MKQENSKKRKTITVIVAVALALVLAMTGTFAWQSLNQKALNENAQVVNPGGRMHDDFDGTNKDVYAENFGDQDLVVRVQLREYMEVGTGAGKNKTELNANRKVEPVQPGTEISKPKEWPVHKPVTDATACDGGIHQKMKWTMGGKTVYMPTFNKNQDSLKADINGTLEQGFADYHKYTLNEEKTANEIFDADNNTVDEEAPVEGTNITTVADQKHTAKETLNGTVMTMDAWKAAGSKLGDYWVYDKDGWAYWANPLKPGTATGLLLDQVELSQVMDDSWYYGINVTGQFATMDDLGKGDKTGFYVEGTAPTAEAEELLGLIGALKEENKLPAEKSQEIKEKVQSGAGDASKFVTIDGTDFYVLNVDNTKNQALLLSRYAEKDGKPVNTDKDTEPGNNQWNGSEIQTRMKAYLNDKPTLKKAAVEMTLSTLGEFDGSKSRVTSKDKVFLLSEADVFGSHTGPSAPSSIAEDYTLGKTGSIVPQNLRVATNKAGEKQWWWLRSPRNNSYSVAAVVNDSTVNDGNCSYAFIAVRPALVVNL